MKTALLLASCLFFFCGCYKKSAPEPELTPPASASSFKTFVILQGEHYCNDNVHKTVETAELKFAVRFDSSAAYKTADPQNQYDINKLYGFSDNGEQHHQFSARFGWRWSDGALRLFAYTYNNGVRDAKELGTIAIGKEVACSIKIAGEVYQFTVNDKTETMPRLSSMPTAKGYQLYPYFGGDEAAPHEVRIWIREESK